MDFLEQIGDFFVSLTAIIERFLTRLFGASNERMMRRLGFLRSGEQTTIAPGSRGGGANYAFFDGIVRFLKFGKSVYPINLWAIVDKWRTNGAFSGY